MREGACVGCRERPAQRAGRPSLRFFIADVAELGADMAWDRRIAGKVVLLWIAVSGCPSLVGKCTGL